MRWYVRDPIFASAVRTALDLGYTLVAYDTAELGPEGDASSRDRTQAAQLIARILCARPRGEGAGDRGHAAEAPAADGWTPMASVVKARTGIDPLTLYAPTMSERQTRAEEDPHYRYATAQGLVRDRPVVFVDETTGALFGTAVLDAYVHGSSCDA